MAKKPTAKELKKAADVLPNFIKCDSCIFLEVNSESPSISYCAKIKMPIATETLNPCVNKKVKQ